MFSYIFVFSILFSIIHNCAIKRKSGDTPMDRFVSISGKLKNLSLYWMDEETRAAADLLADALRHKLGYRDIYLHHSPHEALQNKEILLALSDSSQPPEFLPELRKETGLYCPGKELFVQQYLYVYLPEHFRNLEQCINATKWSFYSNVTNLNQCGFFGKTPSDIDTEEVEIHMSRHTKKLGLQTLKNRTAPLKFRAVELRDYKFTLRACLKIQQKIQESNYSFLFIDDEIWIRHRNVNKVEAPPCIPSNLSTGIRIRLDNTLQLVEYAPLIYSIAHYLVPSYHWIETVNKIVKNENTKENKEEAACERAVSNNIKVKLWLRLFDYNIHYSYTILVFCKKDDLGFYNKILHNRSIGILKQFKLNVDFILISDVNNVKNTINAYIEDEADDSCIIRGRQLILGAVVDNFMNVTEIAETVQNISVPVILYNGSKTNVNTKKSVWLASGNSFHLALALQNFVLDMNWTRIAVLSEETHAAISFYNDLEELKGFALRDHLLRPELSEQDANKVLQQLKYENARIIFLNTNYEDAVTVLSSADKLDMNNGYVWIVREWKPNKLTVNITHISFSLPYQYRRCVKNQEQCTSLSDAVITLTYGIFNVFKRYPQIQYDKRNELTIREFEKILVEKPFKGYTQKLTYWRHSLDPAEVYMSEYRGTSRNEIAKWRVYAAARIMTEELPLNDKYRYAKIQDGSYPISCLVDNKDPYQPICYDLIIVSVLGCIITGNLLFLLVNHFCRPIYKQVSKEVR